MYVNPKSFTLFLIGSSAFLLFYLLSLLLNKLNSGQALQSCKTLRCHPHVAILPLILLSMSHPLRVSVWLPSQPGFSLFPFSSSPSPPPFSAVTILEHKFMLRAYNFKLWALIVSNFSRAKREKYKPSIESRTKEKEDYWERNKWGNCRET